MNSPQLSFLNFKEIDQALLLRQIKLNNLFLKKIYSSKSQKKITSYVHRTLLPSETLKNLTPNILDKAGITRVSDITGLDLIQIPTYTAIRPEAYFSSPFKEGLISTYNGKGFTKEEAKTSAIMEGIERCSAEKEGKTLITASYLEIRKHIPTIDPFSLCFEHEPDALFRKVAIEWMIGIDLISNKAHAIQAANVIAPYYYPTGTIVIQPYHSTTGLASGNCFAEAIVHSLLENIERHTLTLKDKYKKFQISLNKVSSPWIKKILQKLDSHGFEVKIIFYQNKFKIPVFSAILNDPITQDPHLICHGSGAHLSKEIALIRSLTEAIQSRLAVISGTREDFNYYLEKRDSQEFYQKILQDTKNAIATYPELSFEKLPTFFHKSFYTDLKFILNTLKGLGFNKIIAVDLTHPKIKIPVVRSIVPGLIIKQLASKTWK